MGRTSPGVHPPEVGIVAAGGVAIVAGGAVVVEDGVLFRSALLLVDGRITGDNPGIGAVDWVQALVGAGIFFVTFVDDKVDGLGGIANRHIPVSAKVIDTIVGARAGPFGRHTGSQAVTPEVDAPAGVGIVGALIVNGHKALGRGLRGVEVGITLLQPDLWAVAVRVEFTVSLGAIFHIALVDNKVDILA